MDYTEYSEVYGEKTDFYYALFSDLHADAPSFARKEFIADANKYKEKGARFWFNGDVFDMIVSTDRKRYSRASDQFDEDAQVNARIDFVTTLLTPYVNDIDFIGIGNHEVSAVKYDGVDLIKMLVANLNRIRDPKLPPIQRGSYQGFLRLWFRDKTGKRTKQYVVYREHGKGGASPVTKGTIGIQRLHTTYQADLYWVGHSHNDLTDKGAWSIYPDVSGKIVQKRKRSVITGGYNQGFIQRNLGVNDYYRSGFPEEKFLVPTSIGSALLHLSVPRTHMTSEVEAEIIS